MIRTRWHKGRVAGAGLAIVVAMIIAAAMGMLAGHVWGDSFMLDLILAGFGLVLGIGTMLLYTHFIGAPWYFERRPHARG